MNLTKSWSTSCNLCYCINWWFCKIYS